MHFYFVTVYLCFLVLVVEWEGAGPLSCPQACLDQYLYLIPRTLCDLNDSVEGAALAVTEAEMEGRVSLVMMDVTVGGLQLAKMECFQTLGSVVDDYPGLDVHWD